MFQDSSENIKQERSSPCHFDSVNITSDVTTSQKSPSVKNESKQHAATKYTLRSRCKSENKSTEMKRYVLALYRNLTHIDGYIS